MSTSKSRRSLLHRVTSATWITVLQTTLVLVTVAALTTLACSSRSLHVRAIESTKYSQRYVQQFRLALAYVQHIRPEGDTSRAHLDTLEIHGVPSKTFRCGDDSRLVFGCFIAPNEIYFRRDKLFILKHEFVHYILWVMGDPEWDSIHIKPLPRAERELYMDR